MWLSCGHHNVSLHCLRWYSLLFKEVGYSLFFLGYKQHVIVLNTISSYNTIIFVYLNVSTYRKDLAKILCKIFEKWWTL
jgi:hypothetical protein